MTPEIRSLFSTEDAGTGEILSTLLEGGPFRLEQITSFGAASEPGFWYDQENPEWVALIRGAAAIEFETGIVELNAGDYLVIPNGLRHRVTRTSADAVWLAVHYGDENSLP